MIEGVRGVNDRATQNQLPLLEFGIGICFQPSAPLYLMDGERPIMISKALNETQTNMFALACANMIIRGDGKTNLIQKNCFTFTMK